MIGGMEIALVAVLALFLLRTDEIVKVVRVWKNVRGVIRDTKAEVTDALVKPIKEAISEQRKSIDRELIDPIKESFQDPKQG